MREILNNPRQTQNFLDKLQMFEIVDKQRNSMHKIDINKECKVEQEKLGFGNWLLQTHNYIVDRRKKILVESK